MKKNIWIAVCGSMLFSFCLSGCFIFPEGETNPRVTEGYRPVYGSIAQKEIEFLASRPIKNPGKIYAYKNFLLVNESNEGIHVFDNDEPENPKDLGFIQIVGNSDMTVKDDILYADHMGNLVALTIGNFETVTKVGSLPLQNWDLGLPPPAGAYFECIDQTKGLVVRWVKVELNNPGCYAIN